MLCNRQSPLVRRQRVALLTERRAALQKELAAVDAELASLVPVYMLPDDLWSDILEVAYAHNFPDCHTFQFGTEKYPVPMSRVSRYFRHIALNTPKLWVCLHVTPIAPVFARDLPKDQASLLREQLDRSKDLPLTILFACHTTSCGQSDFWMDITTFVESDEYEHFVTCWALLVRHAHRWRRVAFYARHGQLVSQLLCRDVFEQRLSMFALEHLEVYNGHSPVAEVDENITRGLHPDVGALHAPRLKCLRVNGIDWRISQVSPSLPLTELVLGEVHLHSHHFVESLKTVSTTLVTLVMVEVAIEGVVSLVRLPHLRHLVLRAVTSEHLTGDQARSTLGAAVRAILDGSSQLQKLEYDHAGSYDPVPLFAQRSYISVHALDLEIHNRRDQELIRSFPSLKRLTVLSGDRNSLIKYLANRSRSARAQNTRMWPQLERLSVGSFNASENFAACLTEFIEHRAEIGCPLKTLDLDSKCALSLSGDFLEALSRRLEVVSSSDTETTETKNSIYRWDWLGTPLVPHWTGDEDVQ